MRIFSFPPISTPTAKALILGTMPGEMSLKLNQYYGHGGNAFWKLVFTIFQQPFSNDYEKRKDLLVKNNLALWDVLKACVREGSSDNAILQEEPNDFTQFFNSHPEIETIIFNGKNAESYFKSYFNTKPNVNYLTLPSTSPANTWKSFDEKLEDWQVLKAII